MRQTQKGQTREGNRLIRTLCSIKPHTWMTVRNVTNASSSELPSSALSMSSLMNFTRLQVACNPSGALLDALGTAGITSGQLIQWTPRGEAQ
jgi:hypothetical protein